MALEPMVGPVGPTTPSAAARPPGLTQSRAADEIAPVAAAERFVIDETIEIRLGFDPPTGQLLIVDGDVRRQPRGMPVAEPDRYPGPITTMLDGPAGSNVDVLV